MAIAAHRRQARRPRPGALPPGPPGRAAASRSRCSSSARCASGAEADGRPVVGRRRRPGDPGRPLPAPHATSTSCRSCGTSLRGDMTLVGPRPERPEMVAELERQYSHYTPAAPVQAGDRRLGPASLRLRGLRPGHRLEALPRPLLHQAPLGPGRPADHLRDRLRDLPRRPPRPADPERALHPRGAGAWLTRWPQLDGPASPPAPGSPAPRWRCWSSTTTAASPRRASRPAGCSGWAGTTSSTAPSPSCWRRPRPTASRGLGALSRDGRPRGPVRARLAARGRARRHQRHRGGPPGPPPGAALPERDRAGAGQRDSQRRRHARRPRPAPAAGPTARERQILGMLAAGDTDAQIAAQAGALARRPCRRTCATPRRSSAPAPGPRRWRWPSAAA